MNDLFVLSVESQTSEIRNWLILKFCSTWGVFFSVSRMKIYFRIDQNKEKHKLFVYVLLSSKNLCPSLKWSTDVTPFSFSKCKCIKRGVVAVTENTQQALIFQNVTHKLIIWYYFNIVMFGNELSFHSLRQQIDLLRDVRLRRVHMPLRILPKWKS